ncbi:MAG: hypothetical protein U1G07_03430 [Verrucomicrobiota bacterium]
MKSGWLICLFSVGVLPAVCAAGFTPAAQTFEQEISRSFTEREGLPGGAIQLIDIGPGGVVRAFAEGRWFRHNSGRWSVDSSLPESAADQFILPEEASRATRVAVPWREVRQVLRFGATSYIIGSAVLFRVDQGAVAPLDWPRALQLNQAAVSPDGILFVAASNGLQRRTATGWEAESVSDEQGRTWGVKDVLGLAFDAKSQLWFASKAGVCCRTGAGWTFYTGKEGLPWNDFTGIAPGRQGDVWFATHLGAIRFDGHEWHYRQGRGWLPHDDVVQISVDASGQAWFATGGGVGTIGRESLTLARKADQYEAEIEQFIRRTSFGYVAEAHLSRPGDRTSAQAYDSDNDGLWTAMYGAGECFAYAATRDPKALARAKKAFEALRFLQSVTQGGDHSPPHGYIARTIRPVEWPDPNAGRLQQDREAQKGDSLWKAYEPRWPKSADGRWYWKSDTSSDELDGHFFFYPLYYDLCAETEEERGRVREVVRGIADHLVSHDYVLIDHDGRPTRWGVYGPQSLNRDPRWWPERGLNSLSMLSYLAVAAHVTGEAKYAAASRNLIEQHGYLHNAMYPKVQQGPGSGNQSDDEMAFMCYYSLLRYSPEPVVQQMMRYSFFRYWVNEAPEMNPFFNFAFAAHNQEAQVRNVWGNVSVRPWDGWHEDAMTTLYGFPLDRVNWAHKNSHRLDIVGLSRIRARDLDESDHFRRGHRTNGKVLPIENRYFTHWNTDPWHLDYDGNGNELAAGTVFLLPYYMGMYHGFIEKPVPNP